MTQLIWNKTGERYFEAGVDHGVLYLEDGTGIVWNGLIAVTRSPSGGERPGVYIDGVKHLGSVRSKELNGSIEAYTYPDEFSKYDGIVETKGISIYHQKRKAFGLSYRTRLGNDLIGDQYGYRIHLVYNALAEPSDRDYESLGDDLDAITFSWDFSTMPNRAVIHTEIRPTSHIFVDSTKTNATQLRFIEEYLYGTESQTPKLPTIDKLLTWFKDPLVTLRITPNATTGMASVVESKTVIGDVRGRKGEGLYVIADGSRLVQTATEGLYTLEP